MNHKTVPALIELIPVMCCSKETVDMSWTLGALCRLLSVPKHDPAVDGPFAAHRATPGDELLLDSACAALRALPGGGAAQEVIENMS